MITELKNIYRNIEDDSIVLCETHDAIKYGNNRSKYFGPANTYLTVEWKSNGDKINIISKNIISCFPNQDFKLFFFLKRDDSKYLSCFVEIFDEFGILVCMPSFPSLKIYQIYPKMRYIPSISFSWYNIEKIEDVMKNSNIEICINSDIEVIFWFPDYREECCLISEKRKFSEIYCSLDEQRYLDPTKNQLVWY